MAKKYHIGYTAGAFDMFHIGHLNLLRRAKENCDYLIVGVTSDEIIEKTKGHPPVVDTEDRMKIVESIRYVDEVVVQDDLDKVAAWEKLHYDVLFSGDDWKGTARWQGYEDELKKRGADLVYFSYTKEISSTKLREKTGAEENK